MRRNGPGEDGDCATGLPPAEAVPSVPAEPRPVNPRFHRRVLIHLGRAFAWDLQCVRTVPAEKAALESRGVGHDFVQRYAAWRRSALLVAVVPALVTALLATLDAVEDGFEGLSGVGAGVVVIGLASLYALPAGAFAAAVAWSRLPRSHRLVFAGWAAAFLPPFLIAFCPVEWQLQLSGVEEERQVERALLTGAGLLFGISYYVMLMPTVLSLIPGLLRACVRVKTLLPASIVPGWFLVAGAPLYLLLWLVVFIAFNHFAGNLLLIAGVMLWLGAPMLYVLRAGLFVRPLTTPREFAAIGKMQLLMKAVLALALVLLLVYLLTKKVLGLHIVGLDPERSLLWLWENRHEGAVHLGDLPKEATSIIWIFDPHIVKLVVEYVGRALFTTVVFADVLLQMNLSVWRQEQRFYRTAAAADYDEVMSSIPEVLGQQSQVGG